MCPRLKLASCTLQGRRRDYPIITFPLPSSPPPSPFLLTITYSNEHYSLFWPSNTSPSLLFLPPPPPPLMPVSSFLPSTIAYSHEHNSSSNTSPSLLFLPPPLQPSSLSSSPQYNSAGHSTPLLLLLVYFGQLSQFTMKITQSPQLFRPLKTTYVCANWVYRHAILRGCCMLTLLESNHKEKVVFEKSGWAVVT